MKLKVEKQPDMTLSAAGSSTAGFTSADFKCVGCFKHADILFQGSSFCQGCLKERLRQGTY